MSDKRPVSRTFRATLDSGDSAGAISLPFAPKAVFGKARAPVVVTVNGYSYRSTVADMGTGPLVPLRRRHREAAGLRGGKTVEVRVELDTEPRVVEPPADLVRALKAADAWKAWQALSFTHQREHVEAIEDAKKPETRARRIARAIEMVSAHATTGARRGKTRSRA